MGRDVGCTVEGDRLADESVDGRPVAEHHRPDTEWWWDLVDELAELGCAQLPHLDFDRTTARLAGVRANEPWLRRRGRESEQAVVGAGGRGRDERGTATRELVVERLPAEVGADDGEADRSGHAPSFSRLAVGACAQMQLRSIGSGLQGPPGPGPGSKIVVEVVDVGAGMVVDVVVVVASVVVVGAALVVGAAVVGGTGVGGAVAGVLLVEVEVEPVSVSTSFAFAHTVVDSVASFGSVDEGSSMSWATPWVHTHTGNSVSVGVGNVAEKPCFVPAPLTSIMQVLEPNETQNESGYWNRQPGRSSLAATVATTSSPTETCTSGSSLK